MSKGAETQPEMSHPYSVDPEVLREVLTDDSLDRENLAKILHQAAIGELLLALASPNARERLSTLLETLGAHIESFEEDPKTSP